MKKLMTIMMAIVIAVTSFNVAPVQRASAEETGERVLYTTDWSNGNGTRAIVSADEKTVNYYGVKFATDKQDEKQDEKPDTNIVIGKDGFAFVTTIISKNEKYKIIENNDYRFKLENEYGWVYLMDDTHFLTKISDGDGTNVADWKKTMGEDGTGIGYWKEGELEEADVVEKMAKGQKFSFTLMGVEDYARRYNGAKPVINWTSSDPSVASVDNNGVVKSKKYGTTTITAQFNTEEPTTVKIKVVKNVYKAGLKSSSSTVTPTSGGLEYMTITSMKFDKKGNLVCVYKKRGFYKLSKSAAKATYTTNHLMKIVSETGKIVFNDTIVMKHEPAKNYTKTFVIKKKELKRTNFDLTRSHAQIY